MRPLTLADIPPPAVFAAARSELKQRVIAHKAARRVAVGNCASLLFEDRETLRWQVLEMCRVEGVRDAAGVQRELDIYNELLPAEGALSATLFIEIGEPGQVRAELDRLIGLDEYVSMQIGSECIRAGFDPRQMEEDRISAVQYLRFALSPAQLRAFADPAVPLRLAISHPNYAHTAEIGGETRASLLQDLRGGAPPLLDFAAYAPAPAPASVQIGEILERAKQAAVDYYQLTGKPLGITGEIGEYEAMRLLGLTLAEARESGYDATDENGVHYQIKTRSLSSAARKKSQRIGSINLRHSWDFVLFVLMDENFQTLEIWKARRDAVEETLNAPGSRARNERRALAISKFKQIGEMVWPSER